MGGIGPISGPTVERTANASLLDARERFGMASGNAAAVNDTAISLAVAAAVSEGYRGVWIPGSPVPYSLSVALPLQHGTGLFGEYRRGADNTVSDSTHAAGTMLKQTASLPVIQLTNQRNGFEYQGLQLSGLHLKGGTYSVSADNGAGQIHLADIFCDNPTDASWYWKGQIQEWTSERCRLLGGAYGIRHVNSVGVSYPGGPAFFDKSIQRDLWVDAATTALISLEAGNSNSAIFELVRLIHGAGNGVQIAEGRHLVFRDINCEYAAGFFTSGSRFVPSTCSTTKASAVVTGISSTANLTAGDTVIVSYAGGSAEFDGKELRTTILSVDSASQITLNANAQSTCVGVTIRKARGDEFTFLPGNTAANVTIQNWYSGGDGTSAGFLSEAGRSFDLTNAVSPVQLINCSTAFSPGASDTNGTALSAYDPNGKAVNRDLAGPNTKWIVPRAAYAQASGWQADDIPSAAIRTTIRGRNTRDSQAPTSGRMHITGLLKLKAGTPIFNVRGYFSGAPTSTTNHWFCLLSADGSYTVLAKTEDKLTTAWGANAASNYKITNGPYVPGQDTDVLVGFVFVGTVGSGTLPAIASSSTSHWTDTPVVQATIASGITDPTTIPAVGAAVASGGLTVTAGGSPSARFFVGVA